MKPKRKTNLKNRIETMNIGGMKIETIDITKQVGSILEKAGFGDDSTGSSNIREAGIWELMDAQFTNKPSKFTKAQAEKEMTRRGL